MLSPDGKYLLTARDRTARLWDVATGNEVRRFAGHTEVLRGAEFSPDGKYILTASDDGTTRLWNIRYEDDVNYLCSRLQRDFSDDERAQYEIKDTQPTCPKS